jgi:hypothetical protein
VHSSPQHAEWLGYRAVGRYGDLGLIVEVIGGPEGADGPPALVVRGGVANGLKFFVPVARVRSISTDHRRVLLDVDLADFEPRLDDDGTVELRARD